VLDELTARGITWLTLRMRGKAELARLAALPASDWRTVRIDRPGRSRHPRLHEDLITLPDINAKVRQIAVKGAGHWVHTEAPEVMIEALRRFARIPAR